MDNRERALHGAIAAVALLAMVEGSEARSIAIDADVVPTEKIQATVSVGGDDNKTVMLMIWVFDLLRPKEYRVECPGQFKDYGEFAQRGLSITRETARILNEENELNPIEVMEQVGYSNCRFLIR